eukprot:scaffold351_cov371-Prasinococcus_capsulatus_cf.AAC.20
MQPPERLPGGDRSGGRSPACAACIGGRPSTESRRRRGGDEEEHAGDMSTWQPPHRRPTRGDGGPRAV